MPKYHRLIPVALEQSPDGPCKEGRTKAEQGDGMDPGAPGRNSQEWEGLPGPPLMVQEGGRAGAEPNGWETNMAPLAAVPYQGRAGDFKSLHLSGLRRAI